MEIGQQFLMLQIDQKITSNDLSILIFNDRIVFCTLEKTLYFELDKGDVSSENLTTWFKYHDFKKNNCKCILFESSGVLVPKKLFDEKEKKVYLSLSEDGLENKITESKFISSNGKVFVFSQNRDWRSLFNTLIVDIEITHFAAELIPFLSKISNNHLKKIVFIHLRKDFFDLFIYQGSQLLLFNSFPQQNEEDFLYYLFFVLEQFYLKKNQFKTIFLGKFSEYQNYYDIFQEFHTSTEFCFPINLETDSEHPAPFFNYFFHYENNFRKI